MKRFMIFLILGIAAKFTLQAQVTLTTTATCNSLTVSWELLFTTYGSFYSAPCADGMTCCRNLVPGSEPVVMQPTHFTLYSGDHNSLASSNVVRGPQSSPTFTDLPFGRYFIRALYPVPAVCSEQNELTSRIRLYRWNEEQGQMVFFGFQGAMAFFVTPSVTIGNTLPAHNKFHFRNEEYVKKDEFCPEEEIFLSHFSTLHDRYWIAIFEQGGLNRWESTYWRNGYEEFDMSLTDFWRSNHPNWVFEPGLDYEVQYVIEAANCLNNPWNDAYRTFHICEGFQGGGSEEKRLSNTAKPVSPRFKCVPNPASQSFFIMGLKLETDSDATLAISDMAGKTIREEVLSGHEIDVSDLPNGLYIVSLFQDGVRKASEKLMIQN